MELGEQDNTEPVVAVAVGRGVAVAVSRPAKLRVVAPTATAYHPVGARFGAFGVRHGGTAKIFLPPVQAPLPHISVHVIESPGVGQIGAHLGMIGGIPALAVILIVTSVC